MKPLVLDVICPYCGATSRLEANRASSGEYQVRNRLCRSCRKDLDSVDGTLKIHTIKQEADSSPPPAPPPPPKGSPSKEPPEPKEDEEERQFLLSPPPDPAFVARLKSVMRDNKFDRRIPNRKRGKLDMKRLPRVAIGKENVFTQKLSRKNKEFHVKLLVDTSGSMENKGKIELAAQTAEFLAMSLKKASIDFSVDTFNFWYKPVLAENKSPKDLSTKIQQAMYKSPSPGRNANHDAMAVRRAVKELGKHKYGKLLIVFSDGSPVPNSHDYATDEVVSLAAQDGYEYLCSPEGKRIMDLSDRRRYEEEHFGDRVAVKNEVKKAFGIQTLGVGILNGSAEDIYPNHIIVDDLNQFKDKVIEALKPLVKRV